MIKPKPKQLSLYSILYNKISDDHLLKSIDKVVDFIFINKMLAASNSKHFDRPVKEILKNLRQFERITGNRSNVLADT